MRGEVDVLEQTSILPTLQPIIGRRLIHHPRPRTIHKREPLTRQILRVSDSSSPAIGWIALMQARPSLDAAAEERVVTVDVASGEVLDDFNLTGILADGAESYAEAWKFACYQKRVSLHLVDGEGDIGTDHCRSGCRPRRCWWSFA